MKAFRACPVALLVALALTGCAPLPSTDGLSGSAADLAARGRVAGDPQALAGLIGGLAGKPLDRDTAVRIALLNNPRLREDYARLGFAAADVYEAARPQNPSIEVSVMDSDERGSANQVGVGISQHLTDLLMLGARTRLAEGDYERTRQLIGASALEVAADAESAWLDLASASQAVTVREAIAGAASTSAGLAQRVFEAGNISRLELALEKAAAAEASLALMQARAELRAARADLGRVMGLGPADDGWRGPTALPGLPSRDGALEDLLALADRSRLDLAAARTDVHVHADALGITRRFRLLGEVDAGLATERETDRSRITGPSLALQLPVFDQGAGRVARARAALEQSEARLRALEVDISAAVRAASDQIEAARERTAHYRDVLIPLREQIVSLMQRQVNFMLDDPARLIHARKDEYEAYGGYLEAVRDYWRARSALTRAVGAALPGEADAALPAIDASALVAPADGGAGDHGTMDHGAMNHEGMHHEGPEHPGADVPAANHHQHGEQQ